jgi:hypothetical protein
VAKHIVIGALGAVFTVAALGWPFKEEIKGDLISASFDMSKGQPGRLSEITLQPPHSGTKKFDVAALNLPLDPSQKNITATVEVTTSPLLWTFSKYGDALNVSFSGPQALAHN